MNIPNHFTACETYRGFTIATYAQAYGLFDADGTCVGDGFPQRASARRFADLKLNPGPFTHTVTMKRL